MNRVLTFAAVVLSSQAAFPAFYSTNYVRVGLLVQFDGIENKARGEAHDAAMTKWTDLTGNGYNLINLAAGADWVGANGLHFRDARTYLEVNPAIDYTKTTVDLYGVHDPAAGWNEEYFFRSWPSAYAYLGLTKTTGTIVMKRVDQSATLSTSHAFADGSVAAQYDGPAMRIWQPAAGFTTKTFATPYETKAAAKFVVSGKDSTGGATYFHGTIHSFRIYDRVLAENELRHNAAIDAIRFGSRSENDVDFMVAASTPVQYGSPTPAYGTTTATNGESVACSMAGLVDQADATRAVEVKTGDRAVFLGYETTIGVIEPSVATGHTETVDVVSERLVSQIKWLFEHQYLLHATAGGGGTLTVGEATGLAENSAWVAEGGSLTVTAVPTGANTFSHWEGDTAGLGGAVLQATITLPADGVRNVTAVFNDAGREPQTMCWIGGTGQWSDTDNWDKGFVPLMGDAVYLTNKTDMTVILDGPTPVLGKLVVGNTGATTYTKLVCSNWTTCVRAEDFRVESHGIVTTIGGFKLSEPTNRVWMAGSNLTVAAGGKILADQCGYHAGGPCWALANARPHYLQGSVYGGGFIGSFGYNGPPVPYGSAEWPTDPGSANDRSSTSPVNGLGGGAVRLDFTGTVRIDGEITANGDIGAYDSSSSGGSVLIVCQTIAGSGKVLAKPYDGTVNTTTVIGGGGGGGRIAVHYTPAYQEQVQDCIVRFDASSGICHDPLRVAGIGAWVTFGANENSEDNIAAMPPGTLWFPDSWPLTAASYRQNGWRFGGQWVSPVAIGALTFDDPLVLDACNLYLPGSCSAFTANAGVAVKGTGLYARREFGLHLTNTTVTVNGDLNAEGARFEVCGGSLTVNGDVNLTTNKWKNTNFNTAYAGGTVAVCAGPTNGTDAAYGASFIVSGSVNVSAASTVYLCCHPTDGAIPYMSAHDVTVAAGGRISAENGGWGKKLGPGAGSDYQPGASYGGLGGGSNPKDTYGSKEQPIDPGSGASGFPGGGVVRLDVAETLTLNGEIVADASRWIGNQYGSAGSGGSVYVKARKLIGNGQFSAGGGLSDQSSYNFAAGGGGRVAVYTRRHDGWSGTLVADGGYKQTVLEKTAVSEKAAADGTTYFGRLPGPDQTVILVR